MKISRLLDPGLRRDDGKLIKLDPGLRRDDGKLFKLDPGLRRYDRKLINQRSPKVIN